MLDSGTTKMKNMHRRIHNPPGNAHQRSLHAGLQACCICQGSMKKIGAVTWKDGVGVRAYPRTGSYPQHTISHPSLRWATV